MKAVLRTLPILLALASSMAHAELYKWVGPDGKVSYSDTPPPHSAAKLETRNASSAPATTGLPYEVAEAVRKHPVTLYTSTNCAPCNEGRRLLSERGVPFREKTVNSNEDLQQVRKLAGEGGLPLLTVGSARQRGFEASAWNRELNAAGYPTSNLLPRSYRHPAPEPAAPAVNEQAKADKSTAAQAAEAPRPNELPPAEGNAPPGFRF
ncbi:MAG TPA: glutaredoxin family protein [Noviherbaspirillum sp.]